MTSVRLGCASPPAPWDTLAWGTQKGITDAHVSLYSCLTLLQKVLWCLLCRYTSGILKIHKGSIQPVPLSDFTSLMPINSKNFFFFFFLHYSTKQTKNQLTCRICTKVLIKIQFLIKQQWFDQVILKRVHACSTETVPCLHQSAELLAGPSMFHCKGLLLWFEPRCLKNGSSPALYCWPEVI